VCRTLGSLALPCATRQWCAFVLVLLIIIVPLLTASRGSALLGAL
jgi:hypothetical protein